MRLSSRGFRPLLTWLLAGFLSGLLGLAIATFLLSENYSRPALAAGWAVASVNALTARWINRRAMQGGPDSFRRWSLAGNSLRIVALSGILIAVISAHRAVQGPFFVSVFTGIFVFMTVEITELFRLDSGKRETT